LRGHHGGEKRHLIIGVYRPFKVEHGSSLNEQFDKLILHLDAKIKSSMRDLDVIVAGDFNLDYLRVGDGTYPSAKTLNNLGIWAARNGLSQRIKEITRKRTINLSNSGVRHEESLLDHLYSNDKTVPFVSLVGTSDHFGVGLCIESDATNLTGTIKITRRDWRKYNKTSIEKLMTGGLMDDLMQVLQERETADEINHGITEIYTQVLNELAPMRVFRIRKETQFLDSNIEAIKK